MDKFCTKVSAIKTIIDIHFQSTNEDFSFFLSKKNLYNRCFRNVLTVKNAKVELICVTECSLWETYSNQEGFLICYLKKSIEIFARVAQIK